MVSMFQSISYISNYLTKTRVSPIYKYLYYTNQMLRLKDASNNNAQQYSYKNNTILVKQIQVDLDKMKIHIYQRFRKLSGALSLALASV